MLDGKEFGRTVVDTVKGYVLTVIGPIEKRIAALEGRTAERGEKGERGEAGAAGSAGVGLADAMIDRDGGLVLTLSDGRTKALGAVVGADGVNGKDGARGEPGERGPVGEKGMAGDRGDPGAAGERGPAGQPGEKGETGEKGADGVDGKDGRDGKDVDPDFVREVLTELVAAIPAPKDGKDGVPGETGAKGADGRDGKDGLDGASGNDGTNGLNGKDGLDAVSFLRDANGHLVVAMSDGSTKDLGRVDGSPGSDGKPGANGKDGVDGFGFDDLTVEHDGLRKFTFKFVKGDRVKAFDFSIPVVLDKGVYKSGSYETGDTVSHGGSMWIAQRDTADRPGEGDAWRLSVKKGRDGKSFDDPAQQPAQIHFK